jgi:hypothetical protein
MLKKSRPALKTSTWDVEEQASPEIFPVEKQTDFDRTGTAFFYILKSISSSLLLPVMLI